MAECYSYLRFSSKKQEQGDSIRRQEELLNNWLARHPEHTLNPLKLRDLGIGAFRGLNIKSGALGKFIELVKNGTVKSGSFLVIENLDRFSRMPPLNALQHFTTLILAGITIQTLSPEMEINEKNINDNHQLYPVICTLERAHEESKLKSNRTKSFWNLQRTNRKMSLIKGSTIIAGHAPSWLVKTDDGRFEVDPHARKAIEYIFSATINGTGQVTIVKELNKNFPPIRSGKKGKRGKQWNGAYVSKILKDRAVVGEFQFCKFNDDGVRDKCGSIIPNFYPKVIDDSVWHQARASSQSRSSRKGRKAVGDNYVNLFAGLVYGSDGYKCNIQNTRSIRKNGHKYIQRRWQSVGSREGMANACKHTYLYHKFEKLVLTNLSKIKISDLIPANVEQDDSIPVKVRERDGYQRRMEEIISTMKNIKNKTAIASIGKQVDEIADIIDGINQEIERLKTLEASSKQQPLNEAQSLIQFLEENDSVEIREKLRSVIASLISRIDLMMWTTNYKRTVYAGITISFAHYAYKLTINTYSDTVEYENLREHYRISKEKQIEELERTNPEFAKCVRKQHRLNGIISRFKNEYPKLYLVLFSDDDMQAQEYRQQYINDYRPEWDNFDDEKLLRMFVNTATKEIPAPDVPDVPFVPPARIPTTMVERAQSRMPEFQEPKSKPTTPPPPPTPTQKTKTDKKIWDELKANPIFLEMWNKYKNNHPADVVEKERQNLIKLGNDAFYRLKSLDEYVAPPKWDEEDSE